MSFHVCIKNPLFYIKSYNLPLPTNSRQWKDRNGTNGTHLHFHHTREPSHCPTEGCLLGATEEHSANELCTWNMVVYATRKEIKSYNWLFTVFTVKNQHCLWYPDCPKLINTIFELRAKWAISQGKYSLSSKKKNLLNPKSCYYFPILGQYWEKIHGNQIQSPNKGVLTEILQWILSPSKTAITSIIIL